LNVLFSDKHFSLNSDVAESHYAESDYRKIDAFNSMADKDNAEKSLDRLADFLSHIVGTLAQFPSWGRDCQIETFDLSGTFKVSSPILHSVHLGFCIRKKILSWAIFKFVNECEKRSSFYITSK
jgi:hypothetical protein